MITKGSKTHRELNEVNLEKLEGIGPSKELPWNLLQDHLRDFSSETISLLCGWLVCSILKRNGKVLDSLQRCKLGPVPNEVWYLSTEWTVWCPPESQRGVHTN